MTRTRTITRRNKNKKNILTQNKGEPDVDRAENDSEDDEEKPEDEPDEERLGFRPRERAGADLDEVVALLLPQRQKAQLLPALPPVALHLPN